MTRRRLLRARRVTLTAFAVTLGLTSAPALASPSHSSAASSAASSAVRAVAAPSSSAAAAQRATTVTVTVRSITPSVPAITSADSPITLVVAVTNNSTAALAGLSLGVVRGDPIETQKGLDAALADPTATVSGLSVSPVSPLRFSVPANGSVQVAFRTTTSTVDEQGRLCLCRPAAVYPLQVTVQSTVDGQARALGATRTYLPAFDTAPSSRLGVSWVWPIIDRPHRTGSGSEFLDDDLAQSVATGRLSRIVQVVEDVAPRVPLTLLIDPELIDELQIMAAGNYTVAAASGPPTPGTGQQAAILWLARLRTVLTDHPTVDVQLTGYADPDVTRLSQHDLSWTTTLSATVGARVSSALGRPLQHSVAMPPGGAVTTKSLDAIAASGASTVILSGRTVSPSTTAGVPASLARLRTSTGTVTAALTTPVLQTAVAAVVASSGGDVGRLPQLVAELAARVAQNPSTAQVAVLTPPRYVDPSPTAAARAILDTSTSAFSEPVTLEQATGGKAVPSKTGTLRRTKPGSANLSDDEIDSLSDVTSLLPAARSLLSASPPAQAVIAGLPPIIRRLGSASGSRDAEAILGGPSATLAAAAAARTQMSGYLRDVRILPPSSGGSYTLASSNSPVPVTVRNDLPYSVSVQIDLSTIGGLPGFSAALVTKTVPARSKQTFRIPAKLQRSGRIPIQARLSTPSGYGLGSPVKLTVHSTVLGVIGIVITIVAGAVLALALLVRFIRRVHRRRGKRTPGGRVSVSGPERELAT